MAETSNIQKIITDCFSIDKYVSLIEMIIPSAQKVRPYYEYIEYSNFSSYVVQYNHVANYETTDGKKVLILAVKLKNHSYVENARSAQRSYAKKLIENTNSQAALIAYYTEGDSKWRLSYVRLDYELHVSNGGLQNEVNLTPARRYSFLVGKEEPSHTATERLIALSEIKKPTLNNIEEIFSVEKVTNEFFDLYRKKYFALRDHLNSNEDFIAESKKCGFTANQFAKKLMGQIVFLYFLQKKGWLGVSVWPDTLTEKDYKDVFYTAGSQGHLIKEYLPILYIKDGDLYKRNSAAFSLIPTDAEEAIANNLPVDKTGNWGDGSKRFLRTVFEYSKKQSDKNFYNDYLEPLFYDTLNRNRGGRGYCTFLHCRIPFLSGGLFEPIKGYDWKNSNLCIPDEIFSNKVGIDETRWDGILDVFDRYNFTMSEDEPMEREIAIDPEMLGKVFESLLDQVDRRNNGEFYTPRDIVHYMCQESLINYLSDATQISEDDIRTLVLYGDFIKDEDTAKTKKIVDASGNLHSVFDKEKDLYISENIYSCKKNVNRIYELDKALENIRIADPAVGSGAFPVGMLNEIVRTRQTLTEYMVLDISLSGHSDTSYQIKIIREKRSAYNLKKYAIKNSIFAVDIEPSAVDIAQLRLWLSLVIDDEIDVKSQSLYGHRNPLPLPNLECNILCGNSLVDEFEGSKLLNRSDVLGTINNFQDNFFRNQYDSIISELLDEQNQLFDCADPIYKPELTKKIESLKDAAVETQIDKMPEDRRERYNDSKLMQSKPYILWQLDFAKVFRDKGGFDIVIGNPPYIGEKNHKEIFNPVNSSELGHNYHCGKMDYFYYFFHKGLDLLNDNGNLSYITTNYYLTDDGAKILRNDIKKRSKIRSLINFNEIKIFDSAQGQHNMITMLAKRSDFNSNNNIRCRSVVSFDTAPDSTAEEIQQILYGVDSEKVSVKLIDQNDLFCGENAYIKQQAQYSLIDDVISKMERQTYNLNYYATISQGVVPGCIRVNKNSIHYLDPNYGKKLNDGIFVLDLKNPRDLAVYNSFSEESKKICRPLYKNSDISRYYCKTEPTKLIIYYLDALDKNRYPDIYHHMMSFKGILERRPTTYREFYDWTALHRPRNEAVFTGEKIVAPYRSYKNAFAYNNVDWFSVTDVYYIMPKTTNVDIFFLLGVLNSKLTYVWLYNRGTRRGEMLELVDTCISRIPIIKLSSDDQRSIAKYAKQITEAKQNDSNSDTSQLESKIDELLFKAYDLTADEQICIDEFLSIHCR